MEKNIVKVFDDRIKHLISKIEYEDCDNQVQLTQEAARLLNTRMCFAKIYKIEE